MPAIKFESLRFNPEPTLNDVVGTADIDSYRRNTLKVSCLVLAEAAQTSTD
jgi:hypothetical protein